MSLVRGKDSKPEMKLRRLVHELGFRYRLHNRDLPGKPGMVFPSRKAVIFMHGAFDIGMTPQACAPAQVKDILLDGKLEANKLSDLRNQEMLGNRNLTKIVLDALKKGFLQEGWPE